jgi:hypothetical protein
VQKIIGKEEATGRTFVVKSGLTNQANDELKSNAESSISIQGVTGKSMTDFDISRVDFNAMAERMEERDLLSVFPGLKSVSSMPPYLPKSIATSKVSFILDFHFFSLKKNMERFYEQL